MCIINAKVAQCGWVKGTNSFNKFILTGNFLFDEFMTD